MASLVRALQLEWKCSGRKSSHGFTAKSHFGGEGSQYFEPPHIQYISLRKQVLDIIETYVAEATGEMVRFGEVNTILDPISKEHEGWTFEAIKT